MAKRREVREEDPKQMPMDWLDTIPANPPTRNTRPWYYVTRFNNGQMLHTFDKEGRPDWVEHDLRHATPHVYNCLSTAHKCARKYHGEVKSCYYDIHQKWWISIEKASDLPSAK